MSLQNKWLNIMVGSKEGNDGQKTIIQTDNTNNTITIVNFSLSIITLNV